MTEVCGVWFAVGSLSGKAPNISAAASVDETCLQLASNISNTSSNVQPILRNYPPINYISPIISQLSANTSILQRFVIHLPMAGSPGTFGSVTSLRVHMCDGTVSESLRPLSVTSGEIRPLRLNSYKKSLKEVPHAMLVSQNLSTIGSRFLTQKRGQCFAMSHTKKGLVEKILMLLCMAGAQRRSKKSNRMIQCRRFPGMDGIPQDILEEKHRPWW